MNQIESAEGAAYADRALPATHTLNIPPAKDRSNQTPGKPAGLDGALILSGRSTRQAVSRAGFVDVQAGSIERFEASIRYEPPRRYDTEVGLDLVAAVKVAGHMGPNTTGEVNLVLRILAQVDPARVATLLRM